MSPSEGKRKKGNLRSMVPAWQKQTRNYNQAIFPIIEKTYPCFTASLAFVWYFVLNLIYHCSAKKLFYDYNSNKNYVLKYR